jgi:hypothetical protein
VLQSSSSLIIIIFGILESVKTVKMCGNLLENSEKKIVGVFQQTKVPVCYACVPETQ